MKRFFALYAAILTLATSTSYASLAGHYNTDVSHCPSGFYNGSRDWVWVYCPTNGCSALYKLNGRYVEGVVIQCAAGRYYTETDIWNCLNGNSDRPGEVWHQYASDQYGGRDYQTNDGRLVQ
jgi:hypothetical protein